MSEALIATLIGAAIIAIAGLLGRRWPNQSWLGLATLGLAGLVLAVAGAGFSS
jgi:hypothetical protein